MGSEVKSNDELKEICKENVKKNNVQEAKVTFLDATQHSFFIKVCCFELFLNYIFVQIIFENILNHFEI